LRQIKKPPPKGGQPKEKNMSINNYNMIHPRIPTMSEALANPDKLAGKVQFFRELQAYGGRGPGCGKSYWLASWYRLTGFGKAVQS
jgi:hypothetical protein